MAVSDRLFESLEKKITKGINSFAAFLFFLFAFGMIAGAIAITHPLGMALIFVPIALGLIAYYNRDFAIVITIISLLAIFTL